MHSIVFSLQCFLRRFVLHRKSCAAASAKRAERISLQAQALLRPQPPQARQLLPVLMAGMLTLAASAAPAGPGSPPPARSQAALQWVAGELPPFAWQGPQGPQGLAIDLAALMRSKLNRSGETHFYPWARAVRMAQEGASYGVFPLARTPDRETRFNWLIPLTTVHYTFFSRASDPFDRFDAEALKARRIGVLRGSPIIKNLQAENFSQILEGKDYKELLRLLERQHIDAIYAGEPMLRAAIAEFGYKAANFNRGLSLKTAELYMATSLSLDKAEAERWLQAYRELEAEGSVAKLQKKYLANLGREP